MSVCCKSSKSHSTKNYCEYDEVDKQMFAKYTMAYAMVYENNIWGTVIFQRFQQNKVPKKIKNECEDGESIVLVYETAPNSFFKRNKNWVYNFQEYITEFIVNTTKWGAKVTFNWQNTNRSTSSKRERSHWIVKYHKIIYSKKDLKSCVPLTLLQMRKNVLQGTVGVSAAVGNSTKTLQNDDCRKTCLLLAVTNKTKTLWRLSEFSKQDDRLDKERETYTKKLEMKNSLREKVNCEKILKDIESGTIVVGHKSESEVACNHVSSSKAMADDQQSVPEDDQNPVASSRSMVGDPENETRSTAKPKINQNSQPEDCYARKPTASPIIEINDEDNISKEGNIETRYLLDYHDSVVEVIEKPYSSRVDKDYTSRTNSRRDAIFKLKEKQLQDECDRKHLPKEIPIKKRALW